MGKSLVLFVIAAGIAPAPSFAQSSGPGGPMPDISRSDMAPHDAQPKDLYDLRNQIRNDEAVRLAREAQSKLGPARPAKKDELIVGAAVNDKAGVAIAKIEQVDADGVVVSSGMSKVKVPTDAFGHNRAGLLL